MLSRVKKYIHQDCRTEMNKLYGRLEESKAIQNYAMLEAEKKIKDLQERLNNKIDKEHSHLQPAPMPTILQSNSDIPPFDESILEHRNMLLKKVDEQVLEIHKSHEVIKQLNEWHELDEKRISTLTLEIESLKNKELKGQTFDKAILEERNRLVEQVNEQMVELHKTKETCESSKKTIDDLKNQLGQTRKAFNEYKKNCKPRNNKKEHASSLKTNDVA